MEGERAGRRERGKGGRERREGEREGREREKGGRERREGNIATLNYQLTNFKQTTKPK